ncbi:MAG: MATE family efflux transporter [Pseudomonadota bacterium]
MKTLTKLKNATLKTEVKKLLTLAWPLLIAQVTQTLMGVSDSIMAGRYSAVDMAAVAIGFGVTFPILVFIQGLCLALSPQVARLDGAGQHAEIPNWVFQCVYLSGSVGLFFVGAKWLLPLVFEHLSMQQEMQAIASEYVRYILIAAPGFALYQCLRNYCEGMSRTRPTMIIMLTGLLVNIPANYILIYGAFGMPEMGGAGCGLATMMVIFTMSFATFLYTLFSKTFKHVGLYQSFQKPCFKTMLDLVRHGLPVAFTLLAEVTLFASVAVLLASFGPNVVAAHQIALNFSSLIFQIPLSIGLAVAIRIGFCIGKGQIQRAPVTYKAGLLAAMSTVAFTASITVIGASTIASLYTTENAVLEMATVLLFFAAVFQFSDAIQVVGASALRGYKDNKAMLLISMFSYWGVGFPTALILGLTDWIVSGLAARGFWIGFIIGLTCAAIMMTARVRYIQSLRCQ